jgi:TrmH family RNA methyltransferase
MLLEGGKAVADALAGGIRARAVIMAEKAPPLPGSAGLSSGVPVYEVPERLYAAITQVASPQGVMLVAEPPFAGTGDVLAREFILVADRVQDPGNLGSLLRAARAFGIEGVVATEGTADPSSPRALRAAAGTWPGVPFAPGAEPVRLAADLKSGGFRTVVGEPEAGLDFREDLWRGRVALVVGSEGTGASGAFAAAGAVAVRIPLARGVESLNVTAAAAILMAEAARRRALG